MKCSVGTKVKCNDKHRKRENRNISMCHDLFMWKGNVSLQYTYVAEWEIPLVDCLWNQLHFTQIWGSGFYQGIYIDDRKTIRGQGMGRGETTMCAGTDRAKG